MLKLRPLFVFVSLLVLMVAIFGSAPSVTLSSPADGSSTTDTTPNFEFNATDDANSTFSCELFINETSHGSIGSYENGTTRTITASPALTKKQSYMWYVNCTDTDETPLTGQSETWSVYINNTLPTASSVVISPSTAYTNDILNCTYSYNDGNGDVENGTTFRWFNDTGEITGETDRTLDSSKTEIGWNYTCEVTPKDGYDFGTAVNSSKRTIEAVPALSVSFASPTPSNNSYVNGDETVKATATGDIENITIRINGSAVKSCFSFPCEFAWDTTDYDDGPYNVSALANDSAGNSTSIERNITVDNTKPVIKSVSLSDSSVNEGDEVTVKANVSDNIGMDWVKVKVGDDTYTMPYSSSSGLYEEELNAPDTNGTYKVNVTAQDKAGNLAYNDSLTLTVSESSEELETMTVTITGNCSDITVTSSAGTGVYATLQYHSSTAGWITVVNGTKLTDSDGKAKFPITSSGDYKAVCTKSGYNEKTSSVFSASSCTSVPECTADANCTGGKKCVNGTCVTPAPACTANENCSSNKKCVSGSCVSVSCPCGVISNHSCVAYECCNNEDCNEMETCNTTTHYCIPAVQNVTNGSEAKDAVDNANDTISAAKLDGKNTTEAEDFLAQAEEAFESGDYEGALLLASKAKQAALSASVLSKSVNEKGLFEMPAIDLSFISSMDPTLLLCLGGGVIVISAIVILFILFLIFIFFILRKRKTGEEAQKKKRPGKEEWEKPGDEQGRISP